jgi:hypothetical protein
MKRRPVVFLDLDDVLVLNLSRLFTGWKVIEVFQMAARGTRSLDDVPELWKNLVDADLRENLQALHVEFLPVYVISSSWATYLRREQMEEIFQRTGMAFVANNLYAEWVTPRALSPRPRADEIQGWLDANPGHKTVLVIDDLISGTGLRNSERLASVTVLCDQSCGFTAEKLLAAQRILRAPSARQPT